MEIEKTWAFAREEYLERIAKVRRRMEDRELDALLLHTPENICYLSGHQTPGYYFVQVLVVPLVGEPVIVTRDLELGNVRAHAWLGFDQRFGYLDSEDPIEKIAAVLTDLGLHEGRLGLETSSYSFLSIDSYEALKRGLPGAEFLGGSGIVEEERKVKSPAEIAYIRRACDQSCIGMRAAAEVCRPGVEECVVAGEVYKALVAAGAEYPGLPVFLSSGHRSWIPHAVWSEKIIEDGENVSVELTGVAARYAGPLFRTLFAGIADCRLLEPMGIVEDMLEAVIETLRPGASADQVNEAACRATRKAGFDGAARKRAGYSVGLNFPPDWGEGHFLDLRGGSETVLRPGMVFHVPQVVRLDGYLMAAVSETVLVTDSGSEVLTDLPRRLFAH